MIRSNEVVTWSPTASRSVVSVKPGGRADARTLRRVPFFWLVLYRRVVFGTRGTAVLAAFGVVAAALMALGAPSEAWTRGPQRIAGSDRYQTSVDVSNAAFPNGAPAVVLASGEAFPDGLAAGPYAVLLGGPVLLTQRDVVSETVLAELVRLRPTTISVVGGTAAIADDVLAAVLARTAVTPERIAGADRYATAATIASRFPAGASVAYVAGGGDFPDALAAGAAAAAQKAPLLLAASDHAPPVVRDALGILRPNELRVVGGPAAVSDQTEAELREVVPVLRRIAGADRYGTAQALLSTWIEEAGGVRPAEVLVATGLTFPDALAAAPLAAIRRAPLLLTAAPCAPQPMVDGMRDLAWPNVTAIGGPTVVSTAAANVVPCSPVPDGLLAPGLLLSTAVLPGPRVVHLITVDRRQGYDVRAVTTTGRVNGLFPTTGASRRPGVLVAVNGDFFDSKGEPSHALAVNGRILRWPGLVNTLVGFDPARPTFGFFGKPMGGVDLDVGAGAPLPIDMVNTGAPSGEQAALITPEWTRGFPEGDWCWAVLSAAGAPHVQADERTVQPGNVGSASCGTTPVPRGEDVVVARHGSTMGEVLAGLAVGQTASVSWRLHPTGHGVLDAIGSNTSLVYGSKVATDVLYNHGGFFDRREARVAIGQRADSTVVMAVVDKRPGWSIGMTPRELADFLVGLRMLDAANLDGGGSATLAVRGVLANRPADGVERSVNTALVITPHGTQLAGVR